MASASEPDIVVLDLGLPDIDGLDVCAQLRRWYRNPILVLSADGAEDRKVAALDLGADDYVTKPFSMPELLARLRVAQRHRRTTAALADDTVLRIGDLVLDSGARAATAGGEPLTLARKEFDLLEVLARNAGRVLTHRALQTHLWGSPEASRVASLRVHVNQLRTKLGTGPERPQLVTEPGVGYRLTVT
jgi:two-component system KDP operon response regulator KdpE